MTETSPTSSPVIPQLLVGLGNPGDKYEKTRHNIGFMAVDRLAKAWQISWSENRKFQAMVGEGWYHPGAKVRLLKPQTFMNLSGQAIRAAVDWFKLPAESVLVIYDDMDLPFGKLRLRLAGSAGGHNGMKSAIAHLGTQTFPRLRLGIGSPRTKGVSTDSKAISHVLGTFTAQEMELMDALLNLTLEAVELSLHQGVEKAMSLYNNRCLSEAEC
jgi:PTH1 family peptidyl-tRNA hydrolase